MRLHDLLQALPEQLAPTPPPGDATNPLIRGLCYDSRRVAPGDLFVALTGTVVDGHAYIDRALDLGAAAILAERLPEGLDLRGRPAVLVSDSRRAMAPIAQRFFGNPSGDLRLIGVTGTNGKTSITYLVESILAAAGMRTGLIGTVEIRYAGERIPAVNTTPESLDLQRTLRAMANENIEAVVMEVSSHGLELGRVSGCLFGVGAFTNLTQDHLDFHGDMAAYRDSKMRLFRDHMTADGCAVINVDDPSGEAFVAAARARGSRVLRCSRDASSDAEIRLAFADVSIEGSRVRIARPDDEIELSLPLIGDFNLENLMVAVGIATAADVPVEAIVAGAAACPQVPGRMERVRVVGLEHPTVIVDYAHTPDAVDKLLRAVRPLGRGRMLTVFGCGGDRDRAKRPLMANAVAENSDLAIATSDNPRTEDPMQILVDVEAGLSGLTRVDGDAFGRENGQYAVIPDRREAIRRAIALARPEDAVVIAGKGHEDYQIIGREKFPFDDRKEAAKALRGETSA